MSAKNADHPSRVRAWVQNFLDTDDNDLMVQVGENFEYLLDNVDDWESGEFETTDLPHLDTPDRYLMRLCVSFGTRYPMPDATLYAVVDDQRFVGLFGHEENAEARATEDGFEVREVTPDDVDPQEFVDHFHDDEIERIRQVGENMQHLIDNREAWSAGEMLPDEFPHFSQNVKWLMGYSILFGMLWELSHPGLYAVLDLDGNFHDVFGDPKNAREHSADVSEDAYVQRVTVTDGDLPTEEVLGSIGVDAEFAP